MNSKTILSLPLLTFLCCYPAWNQSSDTKKLVILHTNDLHSRLNGFSPESEYTPLTPHDDATMGGFSRIASLITYERAANGSNVLVLDAGDFLMGTFFPMLEESTGFQLPLMKRMGYDVVTLGNHEFDFGPEVLAGIITRSSANNTIPFLVASNLKFSGKETADDALRAKVDQGVLKPYLIMEKAGLKLGIIGLMGYSAIHDAPLARPVEFSDPVKAARKYARMLKTDEKVDLVICLSHCGVVKDKNGSWSGEDVELAQKVPEIDIIIGGHTHTLLEKPLIINGIPVVQTGSYGTGLGRLEIEVIDGKITRIDSKVIPVNDAIAGDPDLQKMISAQEELVTEKILRPLHINHASLITETSFPLQCDGDNYLENSNLGPLVADAIYSCTNRLYPPGADVTLFPAGLVRDNILPGRSGKQSVADIFRVVSLGSGKDDIPGYPLARIYVTGKELKGIMEILYLAPSGNTDNYIYFGGLRAAYDPDKGMLKNITSIETGNPEEGFTPVDWSKDNKKLYSITANTYLLEFVGIIKKLSKGLVKVTLKNEAGIPIGTISEAIIDADPDLPGVQEVKEWMALVWYLQQQPDLNGNGIPDVPELYRTGSPRLHKE